MTNWTTPDAIRNTLLKHWRNGRMLSAIASGESIFPLRIPLRGPATKDFSARFDEARTWIRSLDDESKAALGYGYIVERETRQLRELGSNDIPIAVVVETEVDAFRVIGKERDAERFRRLLGETRARVPCLGDWLRSNALTALEYADDWAALLSVIEWFRRHPRPEIYLRQLDIAGVDTKFIEDRRSICAQLLDAALPPDAVAREHTASANFDARYGLRSKAPLVRFRILDSTRRIAGLSDLSIPVSEFRSLNPAIANIFIVENETNCVAFPDVRDALVVYGRGYAVELLAECEWLKERTVRYWGDIDTHGFSMLDRVRSALPNVVSLLMDSETLLSHRSLWVLEERQHEKTLTHLTDEERDLYEALLTGRFGERVRLEQERISFGSVTRAIASAAAATEGSGDRWGPFALDSAPIP
jgi:hypothetical protein